MASLRTFARLLCALTFIIPMAANAFNETACGGGGYECAGFSMTKMNSFPAGSCAGVPPPTLPPDAAGTFASQDHGGGTGVGGDLGVAAGVTRSNFECTHPIGTASPNGGTICSSDNVAWTSQPQWTYWTPAYIAGATQSANWQIRVYDQSGACTINQNVPFSVGEGNSLNCPPGYTHASTSDGTTFFCARPRRLDNCDNCPSCQEGCPRHVGNPISVGESEKTQRETDFTSGGPFPLNLVRYYGHESGVPSLGEPPDAIQTMGYGWHTIYHRHLWVFTAPLASYVTLRRETGVSFTFGFNPTTNALTPMPSERGHLERLTDGSGTLTGWRYTTPGEETELYDTEGKLVSITSASGLAHTIAYDAEGRIDTVTDAFGRQLAFHYEATGYVDTITAPGGLVYAYAYTNRGALESVTYPDTSVRQYLYENATLPWALTGIIDERGVRLSTYTYNTTTGLATATEHAGGVEKYTVSPTSVTDPLGAVHNYTFSTSTTAQATLLIAVTNPRIGGGYTQKGYSYDANGNVGQYTDNLGHVTKYTFDLTRNLETQRVEGYGTTAARTISTQWHATRRLPKAIAEPLRITSSSYNGETGVSCAPAGASTALLCTKTIQATTDATGASGFSATTDGAPRTWSYTYDAVGHVLTIDGPRTDVSDITTFTYDAMGNLASMTNALSHTAQYTNYDNAGRLLRSVDPAGVETLLDYNTRGWLLHRQLGTAASGYETTTYDYDNAGSLSKVTLPDGSYVQYTYDDAHRLTDVQDGLGNRIHYTLDNMGNRTLEQAYDVQGNPARSHSRVYDILNRISQDIGGTNPSSQVTVNGYDADANLTSITDPLSHVTTNTYDGRNRITQVVDPFNGSSAPTKFDYNGRDQVTKVTDPRNLATTYTFNGHDERLAEVSPSTGTTTFTYDEASNVKTKLDARGIQASYTYDALNRLTQVTYPDETVTYTYDCTGNPGRLCSITDGAATTTYGYDAHGRISSKSQTIGTVTQTVGYTYNAAGQLETVTMPSGHVITYTYENNRPSSVSLDGTLVLDGVFYEPFGPNGGWRWGNSTEADPDFHTRTFDLDFRAAAITSDLPPIGSAAHAFDHELSWDAASRISSIADIADSMLNATYGYDTLDRVTSATQGANSWGYTFDGDGNRKTSTVNSAQTTYSYFTGTNRLQSLTGARSKSYTYDPAGNLTSDGVGTWSYGGDDRPSQVVVGGTTVQFDINALGQRVRKSSSAGATRFMYDESGRQIGEYGDDGTLVEETLWLGDLPVAVVKPDATGLYYVHPDHLGTPRMITRPSDNAIVWRWDNTEPFGNAQPNQDPSGLGTFAYNLRFPGQYYDAETGTNYNYFRDYDPSIGRYVESDPIGLKGGINTYGYAGGNALAQIDPFGLQVPGAGVGPGAGAPPVPGTSASGATGAEGGAAAPPLPASRDRNGGRQCCTDDELRDIARRRREYCKIPNQPRACGVSDDPTTLWRKKYHFEQCIRVREDENRCKGNDPGHDQQVNDFSSGRDFCQSLIMHSARHGTF